jgi:hypothetical protein
VCPVGILNRQIPCLIDLLQGFDIALDDLESIIPESFIEQIGNASAGL